MWWKTVFQDVPGKNQTKTSKLLLVQILLRFSNAETCRSYSEDLQTAIRTAEATGGMLSSAMKGVMVSHLSPLGAIFSSALCAAF